ncbi:MAG: hypothetical protein ACI952_001956, partial [Flavobacteriales bacterium]
MLKINNRVSFKGVLFTLVIFWQTSAFSNIIPEYLVDNNENKIEEIPMSDLNIALDKPLVKLIQIEAVKLTDNSG